jgi:hypothetical protein
MAPYPCFGKAAAAALTVMLIAGIGLAAPAAAQVGLLAQVASPPRQIGCGVFFRKYSEVLRGRHATWQAPTG